MDTNVIIIILAVLVLGVMILLVLKGDRSRTEMNQQLAQFGQMSERLGQAQAEISGRVEQSQAAVNDRLEALSKRLGDGLTQQTEKTGATLKQLHERLAVIDTAQQNITGLSEQMVSLQDILSNKQTRGTFGEIQLNDLVAKVLPPSAYDFQVTLSNGKRADCVIDLPNPPGPIVIDSKFPLEAYQKLCDAEEDVDKNLALRALGADIDTHIKNISDRYIIPGETAESALMFLPSEAIYAELHASLPTSVEKSYRNRVWIVSPTTLWATLNTVRAVLKDVHMREQASVIQAEVQTMLEDVKRLDDRVEKLHTHMRQADKDLKDIGTSTGKITKRGERITEIEMGEEVTSDDIAPAATPQQIAEN